MLSPGRWAAFATLGLITSIGLAWGSVLWEPRRTLSVCALTPDVQACKTYEHRGHDVVWVYRPGFATGIWSEVDDLRSLRLPRGMSWSQVDSTLACHEIVRAGWPLRCLQAERREQGSEIRGPGQGRRFGAIALRSPQFATDGPATLDGCVPIRPLPLGLAANTAFFGAAWAAALLAMRWALTRRGVARRRRGWCSKCGYDLRGDFDGGCPECGWNRSAALADRG